MMAPDRTTGNGQRAHAVFAHVAEGHHVRKAEQKIDTNKPAEKNISRAPGPLRPIEIPYTKLYSDFTCGNGSKPVEWTCAFAVFLLLAPAVCFLLSVGPSKGPFFWAMPKRQLFQ